MADVFDQATRSRIMRAIRSKGTKPELALKAALGVLGLVPVDPTETLPGHPDFYLNPNLAVFVHGCFWHLCPKHYKGVDPTRKDWAVKMDRNRRRDARVRRQLRRLGYATTVVWEHEKPATAAARIARRLERMATR